MELSGEEVEIGREQKVKGFGKEWEDNGTGMKLQLKKQRGNWKENRNDWEGIDLRMYIKDQEILQCLKKNAKNVKQKCR